MPYFNKLPLHIITILFLFLALKNFIYWVCVWNPATVNTLGHILIMNIIIFIYICCIIYYYYLKWIKTQVTLFMSALFFHRMHPGMATQIARRGGATTNKSCCRACHLRFCWREKDIQKGSIFPKVTEWGKILNFFIGANERQQPLLFMPFTDASGCFHSILCIWRSYAVY